MTPRLILEDVGKRYRLGKAGPGIPWWTQARQRFQKAADAAPPAKAQRELWALRDLNFSVAAGTVLGVIGPNGAGKTTLLKVLSRVTLPTTGRITGRGRVISLLELGSGLQPDLSGRENIFLRGAMHGIPRHEVNRRLDDIIEFAGLEAFIDTPVKRYSSGMFVRLAFSVAVNMDPDILLADEVLAVGDLAFQERCLQRVQAAGESGMTVLFVSHDMAAIHRLCERVIWLSAGRLVEDGAAEDVVGHYEASAWQLTGGQAKAGKKGSHVNRFGEILRVRLLSSDGNELGAARIGEPVRVRILFTVLEAGAAVRPAIDLYAKAVHVCRSRDDTPTEISGPGIYHADMEIPGEFLSDTLYTTNASITILRGGEEYPLVQYNALAFQVYDSRGPVTDPKAKNRLAGIVSPRFSWQVERERDIVSV